MRFARSVSLTAALALVSSVAYAKSADGPWSVPNLDPVTRRTTTSGPVVGGPGRYGSDAWLGIPFAAPPIGELRWRAPAPPAAWSEPREALTFPKACPQFATALSGVDSKPDSVVGDEDCLALNVWAPHFAPDRVPAGQERLPVMLWIHGGGNTLGAASQYDGGHLATGENVIVISTQYRLGPLGWFRHAALRAGESDAFEASGNFGTLDLVQALRWIRDNAAAFGGDPSNVTIFGESAGGMNVYSLLLAPPAKGLFQRAIVESGGLSHTTADEAEAFADEQPAGHQNSSNEVLARLLVRQGLASDRAQAKARIAAMSAAETAAFLRRQSVADLFNAYGGHPLLRALIDMPLVICDGPLLPAPDWTTAFAKPTGWNRVPTIVGTNREEAKLFLFFDPHRIWKLFGLFPRFVDEPSYQATAEILSRTWKATGADAPAAAMVGSGEKDVYVYRFDWHGEPSLWGSNLSHMLGAAHAMEIPFVLGHFDLGKLSLLLYPKKSERSRLELSSAMMAYWAQFARKGDPGQGRRGDLPVWSPWDASAPDRPKFLVLDAQGEGGLRMSAETESVEKILPSIESDPRLPSQLDKCLVYHDLAGWTHGLSKADYAHAGQRGCAEYPFQDYPWDDKR